MDHDRAKELFTRFHEGDLADEERAELEQHLGACEDCRADWDSYRMTVDEVSGLLQALPSEDFSRTVQQKIRKRSRGRFFGEQRPFSIWFAVVSFILILLFMLAYLVMTASTEIQIVGESGAPDERASAPERDAGGR